MQILIITPIQEEFNALLHYFTAHGLQTEEADIGRLTVVHLPELEITLAQGGVGKVQFAVKTQHLLDACPDWDLVICAGAAGGLVDDVSVGDVVVATATVEHDYQNKFAKRRLPKFDGAQDAIAELKRLRTPSDEFVVHFAPIASGDEDIVDGERRNAVHELTGASAVAWEGIGGAKACAFSKAPFLEIRGITDDANHHAPSDFKQNLEVAMSNVATFITCWLTVEK